LLLRIVGLGRDQLTLTIIVGALLLSAGSGYMYGRIYKRPPRALWQLNFISRWPLKKRDL
jgi:hypothetical protein